MATCSSTTWSGGIDSPPLAIHTSTSVGMGIDGPPLAISTTCSSTSMGMGCCVGSDYSSVGSNLIEVTKFYFSFAFAIYIIRHLEKYFSFHTRSLQSEKGLTKLLVLIPLMKDTLTSTYNVVCRNHMWSFKITLCL